MKIMKKKGYLLPVIFTSLCIILTIVLSVEFIPDAVSYTLSFSENSPASQEKAFTESTSLYSSLYSIHEDGPFEIIVEDERLFVYCGENRLYRIKSDFSDFPENDRRAILYGLEIPDKATLFEIVGYMES